MFSGLKSLIVCGALLVGAAQAQAGILLEPYLGYHTGDFGQATKNDTSGVSFGARAGYQTMGFMFGVDYMTGKWTSDSTPKADVTPTDIGVFVGYNFPVLLRVYGVYGFKDEAKAEASGNSNKFEGDGSIKLGVGFTGLPFVSLNLEYITNKFDEVNGNKITPEAEGKFYGLTVSLPLDF